MISLVSFKFSASLSLLFTFIKNLTIVAIKNANANPAGIPIFKMPLLEKSSNSGFAINIPIEHPRHTTVIRASTIGIFVALFKALLTRSITSLVGIPFASNCFSISPF